MSNYKVHFLARSVKYFVESSEAYPNLLTAFKAMLPAALAYPAELYKHSPMVEAQITIELIKRWQRPIKDLNTTGISRAMAKFSTLELESALTMKPSSTLPADIMLRLESSLASLEQALLAKDPMLPQHLRQSHQLLISYPETVHLLEDSEIAKLISAAQIHTNVEILKASVPKTGGRKKASADDL